VSRTFEFDGSVHFHGSGRVNGLMVLASELSRPGAASKDDPLIGLVLHSSLAISMGASWKFAQKLISLPWRCKRVVVVTTQRHRELIADLAPQRSWLSKFEMVGIARRPLTDLARLRGDECEMGLASSADRLAYRRDHLCRR
jgi:hypothetical protein